MTTPTPTTPPSGGPGTKAKYDEPVSTLRGAGVDIDGRVVGRVIVVLCLVALAAGVVGFTIAGIQKNHHITELHNDGVRVNVKSTGCIGLLGGSGSNAAGYACRGTFTFNGHRYDVKLPGNDLHSPGTIVPVIALPSDPSLLSPVSELSTQHSSARVFLLPAILLVILLVALALLVWQRRRRSENEEAKSGPAPA